MTRSSSTTSPGTASALNGFWKEGIRTVTDWRETVRDTMKRRGMTRQQLAGELGVNETTLGRWLSGRSSPADGPLRHIGTILGLRLVNTEACSGTQAEEKELLDAFRQMPAAERRLLLQCLRERNFRCHTGSEDSEDQLPGKTG
jgi:transcriptional regulator with XRE-family HTH domain